MGAKAISDKKGRTQKTRDGFHEWVSDRNGPLTVPALPHQEDVTQQGDVVVKSDPLPTLGTTGRGVDDGPMKG